MKKAQMDTRIALKPRRQTPKAVKPTEKSFNFPTILRQKSMLLWWPSFPSSGSRTLWNAVPDTSLSQILPESPAVVSFISGQTTGTSFPAANPHLLNGCHSKSHVMMASIHQKDSQRQAVSIYNNVTLTGSSSTGAPDFGAPLLALTYEPSREQRERSSFPCFSRSKSRYRQIFSSDPSCSQVRSRRQAVTWLPRDCGKSFHLHPVTKTYKMASSVFRSSARGLPMLPCLLRWGSIKNHCSSVIFKFVIAVASFEFTTTNTVKLQHF
jgi:hypothetical protein